MMRKTAVALGSFDGLHRGHMSVIACTADFERECGLSPHVLLFDTHPMLVLKGSAPDKILQDSLRDEILAEAGVETTVIPFIYIKDMPCRRFFEEILIGKLNAGALCCGWNYRFGKGGEGDCETLKALCDRYGVMLKIVPHVDFDGEPISSTRIRKAVENGDIPLANTMLGREFRYKSTVVSGHQRGRLIGAPTINQHFDNNFVLPKKGVYASITVVEGKKYPSVTNIGLRPSFENDDFRSETCILGFAGDLYGQDIEVRLLEYLRDEVKFDSMEKLSAQIEKDAEKSRELFAQRGAEDYV